MKYSNVKINNFRSIEHLELSDLKQINLLVGRNNCGKTSILEALFVLSGMSNPQLPMNIHNSRGLLVTQDTDFSYIFNHLDFKKPISLKGRLDLYEREAVIAPLFHNTVDTHKNQLKLANKEEQQKETSLVSTNIVSKVEGLQISFKKNSKDSSSFIGSISMKNQQMIVPNNYKEELLCQFLNTKTILNDMPKQLEALIVQKRLEPIISVLKEIEPNLQDIRMGANGMVYADVGASSLMPIHIMGDGMRRILAILISIHVAKNGVLLIDEIENGLHHTSMRLVWKAILDACKTYNVQLIATTHSYDCLTALSEYGDELNDDEIRLYRIERDGKEHIAKKADAHLLKSGIANNIEVR